MDEEAGAGKRGWRRMKMVKENDEPWKVFKTGKEKQKKTDMERG